MNPSPRVMRWRSTFDAPPSRCPLAPAGGAQGGGAGEEGEGDDDPLAPGGGATRLPALPDEGLEMGVLPRVIRTLVERRGVVKKMLKKEKVRVPVRTGLYCFASIQVSGGCCTITRSSGLDRLTDHLSARDIAGGRRHPSNSARKLHAERAQD